MQYKFKTYKVFAFIGLLVFVSLLAGCDKKIANEGKLVFTQVPVQSVSNDAWNSIDYKYASSMKIAMADIGGSLENVEILTSEFQSARAPEISFDGKNVVFSGQKNEGDTWQIWVLDFESLAFNQVTDSRTNCTDPTWLPDGSIAFSKLVTAEKGLKYHALFKIGQEGCCQERITFQPHEDLNASVMHDGRLLLSSMQVYPEEGQIKYLALRPDGTKSELFYLPEDGSATIGKANDDFVGDVLFPEAGMLISAKFSRPLHTKNVLASGAFGQIQSIFSMDDQQVLASVKKPGEQSFGLMILNKNNPEQSTFYSNDADYHAIEPVIVRQRSIPKKLPTRVNADVESGYFMCMDSDQSEIEVDESTSRIQVLGIDKVLGETQAEEDGSFYVELAADQPVRFQTVSENGEILRGPSSWMWVRPNERRGCVGCHENREISPSNVVPKAVEKAPIAMIK